MGLTYSEAQTVSTDLYDKTCKQQVYQSSPFWVKLKKNHDIVADGGNNYRWGIRYLEFDKADAIDPDSEFTYEGKATRTTAILEPRFYEVATVITWKERNTNSGKEQVINLIGDKTEELRQDMANRFAKDLYTQNPNGIGFQSLATIIDSEGDYAGISKDDAATWASTEDGTTDELTLYGTGSLAEARNDCTLGPDYPNFHLTTLDLVNKFTSLIEPQKRYANKEMADAGFRNVTFEGDPVFGDYHCPAAVWYGLCLKKGIFKLRHHPDDNMDISKWEPLKPSFPRNMGKYMTWMGELCCTCRKVNFKYTALDYTI